jgi:imidazole glycerol-phosphate synthase subunit HisF
VLSIRIIPALLLREGALVKTVRFDKFGYIGDPVNTVRIFNELEVDELVFLDILATRNRTPPDFKLLSEIADECFMPLAYGGGVRSVEDVKRIFGIGLEKVVINSFALENPRFISETAGFFGSQSIIASIDVKKSFWGKYEVHTAAGTHNAKKNPVAWAKELEQAGAGEILLTSMDNEGTWNGFDIELLKSVTLAVSIPVIAHGGAGTLDHIGKAVHEGHVSAVALGSMVVYQGKDLGVLVNFPDKKELLRRIS